MRSTLLVASMIAAFSSFAHADLLTNGSFENINNTFTGGSFHFPLAQQLFSGSTVLPGWTVTANELAWFENGQAGITTQDGNFAIDLTGFFDLNAVRNGFEADGAYGAISQTISTIVGATYELKYYGGTYSLNTIQPTLVASAGSTTESDTLVSTTQASGTWTQYGFDFVAGQSLTTISFTGTNGLKDFTSYLGVDNVSVQFLSGPNAVPEPSTFALLGLGGIGLAVNAYRRRRTAV